MMMPLMPMKMKTNMSVIVVAALTLLMITLLFNTVPNIPVVAAAPPTCAPNQNVPTPPGCHRQQEASAGRQPVEASAAGGRQLPVGAYGPPSNGHVIPSPPRQHENVHSSIEASAAARCPPSSSCNPHVPTPGCCSGQKSKMEHQLTVDGKAGLIGNYKTSMKARKQASPDHTYY